MIQFSEFRNWKKWCIQFAVVVLAVILFSDHLPQKNTFVMIAVIASWFPIWSKDYPVWSRLLGFVLGAYVSLLIFGGMIQFARDISDINISPLIVGVATVMSFGAYPLTKKIVIWLASDGAYLMAKRIKQKVMEIPLTPKQRVAVMGVLLWGAFVISLDSILNFTDSLAEGALLKIIVLPLVVIGLAIFLWRWATYTNRH